MSYLWLVYGIVFAIWVVAEYRDLKPSGYPTLVVGLEFVVAGLFLSAVVYRVLGRPFSVRIGIALAVVALAAALRVIAFRHEEWSLDWSARANRLLEGGALILVMALLVPGAYLVLQATRPPTTRWGVYAAILGAFVGAVVPRFKSVKRWEAERIMAEWAESPLEHGQTPDETELLDRREYDWPGEDEPVSVGLVRFRIGDDWNVGIVGPHVFAFADQTKIARKSVDEIYEAYRAHFETEVMPMIEESIDADQT